ncbi:MAG: FapA family protein [Treponema sp.]|nr:FapA family protein [Treponema sp.]
MVTLDQIRKDMSQKLDEDKNLHFVDVNADTLDEALADAAVQLDTKVSNLEYEVIEKGSDGFMGISKKHWVIKVYPNASAMAHKKKKVVESQVAEEQLAEEEKIIDKDGVFYVHRFAAQICLKVILPVGNGAPVSFGDVITAVKRSDTLTVEENEIKEWIKKGTNGAYEPVGTYEHVKAGDALIAIDVSKDEMKAHVTAAAPAPGGADVSADMVKHALEVQGILSGLEEDKLSEFIDNPMYDVPVEIASGTIPVDGRDAYIAYNFETDRTKLKVKEAANGQVNFKELNLIQNVVAGQPLAQKMPAEKGKSGKTLFGRYLEAKDGKDIPFPLGKNVKIDSDGSTIVAECNGQVLLVNDKICVEPIMEVDGVNIKTGNITFLGTVIVKGNVDDGFDIKASGNIEIYGTVGKCHLEAEGDIIVSQGIFGRDEGVITTQKSLWAKFIQSTKCDVGEYVIVSDSIMNSEVTAMKRIILQGKKAQITGGHLFATEEICAKNIGSPGGGTETILEVGIDPKAKQRLNELQEMQVMLMRELEEVELNISTLENQKKVRRSLPKEKEESLEKLIERQMKIKGDSDDMSKEIQSIQDRLRELKVVGKVKCAGMVYGGVKVYVREVLDDVRAEVKAVTFYYEDGFVRRGKYEEPSVEDIKAPDGYSSH